MRHCEIYAGSEIYVAYFQKIRYSMKEAFA